MACRRSAWLMMDFFLDSRLMIFNGLKFFDEVFDLSINGSKVGQVEVKLNLKLNLNLTSSSSSRSIRQLGHVEVDLA